MNTNTAAKTHHVLDIHRGNTAEGKADAVFTFETNREANAFIAAIGGRVASKREAKGEVKVPDSIGGAWIDFPARQAFVLVGSRRFLVQVKVGEGNPYRRMLRSF